jgi:2-epi-5-epi-valiolone synthase
VKAVKRPSRALPTACGRALIIERQSLGVWTATIVDACDAAQIECLRLDGGPGREATVDDLHSIAESLAADLGPVDSVIFLAEDTGSTKGLEPRLVAGYPLPVWVVHPSSAIASSVPTQYRRFIVLDFRGGGSASLLKRGAGAAIDDLIECDGDLRSLLSRRPHRQVVHTDLLADLVSAHAPGASAAVAGSAASANDPSALRVESVFAQLLHDLEPMLCVLQSFGYDAVVCVSTLFSSGTVASAFLSEASGIGGDRRVPFILNTCADRYSGALKCVNEAGGSPGVWFAGTIDRPAFSLVTERNVAYDVRHVSRHIFDLDDTTLAKQLAGRQTFAVVDCAVKEHYGRALRTYAARHIDLVGELIVDATEAAKSWPLVERICEEALRCGLGREGIIMAIGGGITLDVTGMAASIFRRGIRYVRVPTTLVGLIDAGVGIKQGVNFASKKNLLGSFYPPFGCVNDPLFLKTLPRRHLACGVAEMIKIALVCDRRLFEILETNICEFLDSHFQEPTAAADESILRAQLSMLQQLQPNLYEHDLRRWVDFGHTFSPTLELRSRHELAHGEAVALDMALATALAVQRRICHISVLQRMIRLYHAAALPVIHELCSSDVLAASLHETRLHRGGNLNLVVPTDVGAGAFLQEVEPSDIDAAARFVAGVEPALAEA